MWNFRTLELSLPGTFQVNRGTIVTMALSCIVCEIGHSNYQIGVNWTKSEIPIIKCGHFARRSTFSLYWIIQILNIAVQNWLNIATHTAESNIKLLKVFEQLDISQSHLWILVSILISINFLLVFLMQPKLVVLCAMWQQ